MFHEERGLFLCAKKERNMEGQVDSSVAPVAAGNSGDTAQSAPVQGDSVQPAAGQGDTPQPAPVIPAPDAKGPIPYDRFEEVNQQAKAAKDRAAALESQLMQTQGLLAQLARAQQPRPGVPSVPVDPFDQISDADLYDPAKMRSALKQARQDAITEANRLVAQVQFQAQYPDFEQVVGAADPMTGQFVTSEIMAEALKADPQLSVKIQRPTPQVFAYEIAKLHKQLRELRAAQNPTLTQAPMPQPTIAHQIRAAQQAPQSISAATGRGTLDKTSHIRNMGDAEFAQYWAKVKAGGAVT